MHSLCCSRVIAQFDVVVAGICHDASISNAQSKKDFRGFYTLIVECSGDKMRRQNPLECELFFKLQQPYPLLQLVNYQVHIAWHFDIAQSITVSAYHLTTRFSGGNALPQVPSTFLIP